MDIERFLARVIAPGGYLAVNWKKPDDKGMGSRFFKRDDLSGAAGFIQWATGPKAMSNVYMGVASYKDAVVIKQQFGRDVYDGERKQTNADHLRGFWIDADVQRPGEKLKPDCYPDRRAAVHWLAEFLISTGLPGPNLRVDSGYGFHWYWLLEDPLTRDEWQPYADALVSAIAASGFKSLAGITSDAARILRPPGTLNYKNGTSVSVSVMGTPRSDYPNDLVLSKLEPWRNTTAVNATPSLQSALASSGPAAAFTTVVAPNMVAAAALPTNVRPRYFAEIATKCEQVKRSLADHGKDEPYQLWYAFLSLAGFCEDGADFVHPISDGDHRYSPANVDRHVAQTAAEQAQKNLGAPLCNSFDQMRPGVCSTCAFKDKVTTPWNLGVLEPPAKPLLDPLTLPAKYNRLDDALRILVAQPNGSTGLVTILKGDVHSPVVDRTPKGYLLSFVYELAGQAFPIRVYEAEMPYDIAGAKITLIPQGLSVEYDNAKRIGTFLQAWITTLRQQHAVRTDNIQPFGYAFDNKGEHIGIAVAGDLYRSNGTMEQAPGGDPEICTAFSPHGVYQRWREAYDLVCTGRPDLQLIVAVAFGAPLMRFTGHPGLVVSAWSKSGTGKSAAIRVGQTVWSAPRYMTALDDTNNAVNNLLGITQCLPCFWDELRPDKDAVAAMIGTLFTIAQGKGKNRLNANITHREIKEWKTLVLVASNAPLMDHVVARAAANDAGALRLLEYHITHEELEGTALAARVISEVDQHYGHAGRMFIEYVATHYDETKALVIKFSDGLKAQFGLDGGERIIAAGIACMLAGATIATKLGIATFDMRGMLKLLGEICTQARRGRKTDLMVHDGSVGAEEVLSRFYSDFMDSRIWTTHFGRAGVNKPTFKIEGGVVPQRSRAEIQIAFAEKTMRINRNTLLVWCRRQGLNGLDVLRQMEVQLRAVKDKAYIGAGTIFSGGRIAVIDVPLDTPEMETYMVVTQIPGSVAALASPPSKGNQPKV